MSEVQSTCPYCGVGCGVLVSVDQNRITAVRGDPAHPANRGKLCSKGSTLHFTARGGGRVLEPALRRSRSEPRQSTTWDEALGYAVDTFVRIIREHGPDAVAFYGSGQLLTEDYYALNKLARAVIGTNNIDTNSRLCMSSAVAGYKATLGADAVPTCYEDIDHADLLFIAGSNTAWAHPVLYRRIETAAKRPRMIVVDPRRTETAAQADLHLPILPGTDVALFHAMLHWWVWEERIDTAFIAKHTEGFAELRRAVSEMSPAVAARVCGVPEADIIQAARWWAESASVLSLYCQGLNQSTSGTDKNTALIALHLATGQIGKPGSGPFSLTGQPNAMGGREVGALANLLPGHREASNAEHRSDVARLWGIPSLPESQGKTAVEMFDALAEGTIKAVWIACTNPAQSMPDLARVHAALSKAECVVVQEAFADSETVAFADVLLPAATWGEKSGTVTNSERRISRVDAAIAPPGKALQDWQIFVAAGQAFERALHPGRASVMAFESAKQLWEEHRALTQGRDLDIGGLTYASLRAEGPQQWPVRHPGEKSARLYTEHCFATASGKARFVTSAHKSVADKLSARFPLALTTHRLRDQWHSMTRTGRHPALFGHNPTPEVHLHAGDLTRRALEDGSWVRVTSARGSVVLKARAHETVRSGQAALAMHWGASFMTGLGVNALMPSAFCPTSKQPELKHAAVRVEALKAVWHCQAFVRTASEALESVRQRVLAHSASLAGAFAIPVGGTAQGIWIELVAESTPSLAWQSSLDTLIGAEAERPLALDDATQSSGRRVWLKGDRVIAARLSGTLPRFPSALWLRQLMLGGQSVAEVSRWLLSPTPPKTDSVSASPVVCTCLGVRHAQIVNQLATPADGISPLDTLQSTLACGTQCGSCLPELKRLIAQHTKTEPKAQ